MRIKKPHLGKQETRRGPGYLEAASMWKMDRGSAPGTAHPSLGPLAPNPPICTGVHAPRKWCKETLRIQMCLAPSRTCPCGGRQVLLVQTQARWGHLAGRGICWATGSCWGSPQGGPTELKGPPELCSFCGKEGPRSSAWPGGTERVSPESRARVGAPRSLESGVRGHTLGLPFSLAHWPWRRPVHQGC